MKLRHFGRIVVGNVGVVRMTRRIVLMVSLGGIESSQGNNLGHDRMREDLSLCELCNIGLCNPLLFIVAVKNRGTVLSTHIRTLPVQLGRIMRHGAQFRLLG